MVRLFPATFSESFIALTLNRFKIPTISIGAKVVVLLRCFIRSSDFILAVRNQIYPPQLTVTIKF